MSNLRVVSITDCESVRTRANLLNDMAVMASAIADELMRIDVRLRLLRAEIERLQQGGDSPKASD